MYIHEVHETFKGDPHKYEHLNFPAGIKCDLKRLAMGVFHIGGSFLLLELPIELLHTFQIDILRPLCLTGCF